MTLYRWRVLLLRRLGRTRIAGPIVLALLVLAAGSVAMMPSWTALDILAISAALALTVVLNWRLQIPVQDIAARVHDIAEAVREYSRSQVQYWRQVPWLYLHMQGLSGYNDGAPTVYARGYWETPRADIFGGRSPVSVDLATGELVWTFSGRGEMKPASDEQVVRLAVDLDCYLNAKSVVRFLERRIAQGRSEYTSRTQEELDAWHAQERERYGVEKIFTRKPRKKRVSA